GENESRYRMLETIREFAGQKLQETDEEAELRARHVEFYAAFAERAQKGIYSTQQAEWFKRLDQEVDNLRAALDWHASSLNEQKRYGLRSLAQNQFLIISSLSLFWERGYRSEIIETLKKMLSLDAQDEPTAEKATALDVGGFLLWSLNRLEEARAFLEESIRIAQQLKDDSLLVWPLMYLGWTFWGLKEYERAREYLERSLSIASSLGESGRGAVAVAMAYLGDIPYAQGNLAKARKVYEEAISMLRDLGNPSMLSPSLRRLAYVEVRETKFDKAVSLFNESLESNLQLGHQHGTIACLAGFAAVHLAKGNIEHAAVLYGCIENLLEQLGSPLLFTDTVEYERSVAHLQQRLDEQILSRAWSKGGKMTLDQAIKLARKEL
ncbi:MAG TPA: tetratricopeptide repeat protein, partial [Candidatus Saccharimonadales bacterium]|nr:tetratricopeptide repeat protein [Candidatus Saccharimonadales bacterium]